MSTFPLEQASLEQLATVRITGELEQARQIFASLKQHAQTLNVELRRTPPEPDTCELHTRCIVPWLESATL